MPYYRRSGSPRERSKMDFSKCKTKICRHYQLGSCPFEDRCAFSHGDDGSPEMSPEASPRHPSRVKSESTMISEQEFPSESTSGSDVYTAPPPAYEVATLQGCTGDVPVYYPMRYRNDPYSYDGIRYESTP